VAEATVKLFATIQKQPREVQLLALAAAFVIQSEALRFDTGEAYQAITNLMKDNTHASGRDHRFDAMAFHIRTELDKGSAEFNPADGV